MASQCVYQCNQSYMRSYVELSYSEKKFIGLCAAASCYWIKLRSKNTDFVPLVAPTKVTVLGNVIENATWILDFGPEVKHLCQKFGAWEVKLCESLDLHAVSHDERCTVSDPASISNAIKKMKSSYGIHDEASDFLFSMCGTGLNNIDGHVVAFRDMSAKNEYEAFDSNFGETRYYGGATLMGAISDFLTIYREKKLFNEIDLWLVSNAPLKKKK